jgi:hypothetical protein
MVDEAFEEEGVEGAELDPAGFPHHAMFPRDDDGPETRDIVWIQLLRMLPDGTVQTCPDQFAASDLPNWGEVYRRFGGGKYRAKGRNARMQWQAEAPGGGDWLVFDGASRPFAINPPPPPVPTGPTLAEAIVGLGNVLGQVGIALINRPPGPSPPPPDNTLAVAMVANMAALAQASHKATVDVLVALLLSRGAKRETRGPGRGRRRASGPASPER